MGPEGGGVQVGFTWRFEGAWKGGSVGKHNASREKEMWLEFKGAGVVDCWRAAA